MSIIDRYIFKEILFTMVAVVLVLLLILFSANLAQIFRDVATGVQQLDTLLVAVGLEIVVNFELLLPLSFFLAILLALGRMYKDSEMIALAACGFGQRAVLRSVLILALVSMLVTATFSLFLSPWAKQTVDRLSAHAKASSELSGILPGRFKEFSAGQGAVYVEDFSEDSRELRNVFGHRRTENADEIFSSRYGYQETDKSSGDRYVVLENGRRYEGRPGEPDYKIVKFERHGIRIEDREVERVNLRHTAVDSRELLNKKDLVSTAELQSRISAMLMTFVLAILAVPLSRTSPRQGQYSRLALAILIYIIYSNMLNVSTAWVQKGKIPPYVGVWWVHGLMFLVGAALIYRQTRMRFFKTKRLLLRRG